MKRFLIEFLKTLGFLLFATFVVVFALDKLGGFWNLCMLLGFLAVNHIVVTGYNFLTTDCDGEPRTGFVGVLRVILFIPMMVLGFLDLIYRVTANLFDTMEEEERKRPGYFKSRNEEKIIKTQKEAGE